MFVLSLISSPQAPAVDSKIIVEITSRLGISQPSITWLANGIACDIALDVSDDAEAFGIQEQARVLVETHRVDANVVSTDSRRKQILIADMDSTMIHQECIDELGIAAGAGEHIQEITRRAMRGELDFVEALNERVSHMKGLPESAIQKVIDERITFVDGGRTLAATMAASGAHCALISGGFSQFTTYVAGQCGFHAHQANHLIIENGTLTGTVAKPELGSSAKVEALNRMASERGLTTQDALTVGDGANDVAMIQAAGMGVAMHAKPAVRQAARTVVNHADLTAPLYLQGYHADEFVN